MLNEKCLTHNKKLNNEETKTNPLEGSFLNTRLVMWS